ncbi:hypothetical protein U1Q18_009887, partial [Sarracenia purpurea var. burkii]
DYSYKQSNLQISSVSGRWGFGFGKHFDVQLWKHPNLQSVLDLGQFRSAELVWFLICWFPWYLDAFGY